MSGEVREGEEGEGGERGGRGCVHMETLTLFSDNVYT